MLKLRMWLWHLCSSLSPVQDTRTSVTPGVSLPGPSQPTAKSRGRFLISSTLQVGLPCTPSCHFWQLLERSKRTFVLFAALGSSSRLSSGRDALPTAAGLRVLAHLLEHVDETEEPSGHCKPCRMLRRQPHRPSIRWFGWLPALL